jgi:rubredoxin
MTSADVLVDPLEGLRELAARAPLPRLDGEASPETQAIARAIGANGFALNRWWVLTPMWWVCPACNRPKFEIARLNQRGEMMGELHAHHDHVGDFIMRRFHEVSGSRQDSVATESTEDFLRRAVPLVTAFDETVICADCNTADAKAKRIVGVHPDFSFSPQEIGRFVEASPNQDHKINADTAQAIWQDGLPAFKARLRIIEHLVELVVRKGHWFQPPLSWEHRSESIERAAKSEITKAGYNGEHHLETYIDGARSIRKPTKDLSAWRMKRYRKPVKVPTTSQIEHVSKVSHHQAWMCVPDDWTCPCCGRSKRELVKPSGNFPWSFGFARTYFHETGHTEVICCGDCNNARLGLIKEAGCDKSCVSVCDVRDVVVPAPHAPHIFRNDTVVAYVLDRMRSREPLPPRWSP